MASRAILFKKEHMPAIMLAEKEPYLRLMRSGRRRKLHDLPLLKAAGQHAVTSGEWDLSDCCKWIVALLSNAYCSKITGSSSSLCNEKSTVSLLSLPQY